jgi:hypothetical protein
MIILIKFATGASYGNCKSLLVIVASQCLKMVKVSISWLGYLLK